MGLLLSIIIGFISSIFYAWLVYTLDRYEKEPKLLLGGVFFWGVFVAAGGAFIVNTLLGLGVYFFTGSEFATDLTTGSLIAPLVEESLKGLAVFIVFLIFRREFDSILDGIVYAGIVALGFAATENSFYIYTFGYQEGGIGGIMALTFIRTILVGWQHPFYTAFIGIGFAVSRLNRDRVVQILAPVLGWTVAVMTHAFHNTMASFVQGIGGLVLGTFFDWTGWLLMFGVIVWAIWREQQWITHELKSEVTRGVITEAQYQTARSSVRRLMARYRGLGTGQYRSTYRFYQTCTELAYKKHHRVRLGETAAREELINSLRQKLIGLSPVALS